MNEMKKTIQDNQKILTNSLPGHEYPPMMESRPPMNAMPGIIPCSIKYNISLCNINHSIQFNSMYVVKYHRRFLKVVVYFLTIKFCQIIRKPKVPNF